MSSDQVSFGIDLGAKLRMLRRSRSMTMSEIALAAGCSESMISKIERGRVNPSISLLHRLAETLDTTFAALFHAPAGDGVVSRAGSRPRITAAGPRQGVGHIIEQLVPLDPAMSLQGNLHIIAPGGTTGEAISHYGDEMGYVLEGQIELHLEDKTHIMNVGDTFHFQSKRSHTYRNSGSIEARLIIVNTPPSF